MKHKKKGFVGKIREMDAERLCKYLVRNGAISAEVTPNKPGCVVFEDTGKVIR